MKQKPKQKIEAGKKTKRLLKLSPVTLTLLMGGLALGVLIIFINPFAITMTEDYTLGGGVSTYFAVDGEQVDIEDPALTMTPDVFSDGILDSGETEEFIHTFNSQPDNGNFEITFDTSIMDAWTLDPEHEFYGYTFTVLNLDDTPVDTPLLVLNDGGIISVKFVHNLHSDFVETANTLPFELVMNVIEHLNTAPVGVDDGTFFAPGEYDVLSNDYDLEGDEITIVDVTPNGDYTSWNGVCTITGTVPNQQITYSQDGAAGCVMTFTYTIEDPDGFSDTATITIDLT